MPILKIVALSLEGLLGVFSLYTAYSLFSQTPPALAKARAALRYARWYWVLAGVLALIGGAGLLVGIAIPFVGALAALWMIAYFIVASFTHILRKDFASLATPIIILLVFVGLTALRWADVTPLLAQIGVTI